MTKEELESKLIVGTKIKLGEQYCKNRWRNDPGKVIELVEGVFEHDNGLYTEEEYCPSIWHEKNKDFYSIYHLFGNDLEEFEDCEILEN